MSRIIKTPIVIFSFSRPDYLERLCISLKLQQLVSISESNVYLLQDGPVSPRSGVRYAEDAAVQKCVDVFRRAFANGNIIASDHNLGLALNILRGEQLVFERLKLELGYFFEDDLELGPLYLHAMEEMRDRCDPLAQVGYFAAYGNFKRETSGPAVNAIPLEHHWGFGLYKRCWTKLTPWMRGFNEIWKAVDYQARPHARILKLYKDRRVAYNQSSQDVAKSAGCADLGFARLNTDVCFARYIGAKGESFRPEGFAKAGFEKMAFVESGDFRFQDITPALLESILDAQFARYADYRKMKYDRHIEEYTARVFDPDLPVTRKDVDDIWRIVMDRIPEGDDYYERTVGKITIRTLRSRLMQSREGRAKNLLVPQDRNPA